MNEITKKFAAGVSALGVAGIAFNQAGAKGRDCLNPTAEQCRGPQSSDFGDAQQCLPSLVQGMTGATMGSSSAVSTGYFLSVQAAHEVDVRVYNVDAMMFVSPRIPKATLINSSAINVNALKLT